MKLDIDQFEIDQLMNKYRMPDGQIDYLSFCRNINSVFFDQEKAVDALKNSKSYPNLKSGEETQLNNLLDQISSIVNCHSILLKPHFQAFDKTNCQHITLQQFGRVLKTLNLYPTKPIEFEILARAYSDNKTLHEVNYFQFVKEVDAIVDQKFKKYVVLTPELFTKPEVSKISEEEFKKLQITENRFSEAHINLFVNPEDVEEKVRAFCLMERIRIEEYFRDFDKLRKGIVTKPQFRENLSILKIRLAEDEFIALENKYSTKEGMFNYYGFCDSINRIFAIPGIEKSPKTLVNLPKIEETKPARRKKMDLTKAEIDQVYSILVSGQKIVKCNRVHFKPFFQDFDIAKSGFVTKTQFIRVLDNMGIKPSENVINLLLKVYMNKGNYEEVNYVDFCNDIDKPEDIYMIIEKDVSYENVLKINENSNIKRNKIGTIVSRIPDDVEDVLARIRKSVKEQRMRVSEFMRDYDKLRSGFITKTQLRQALNLSKITLSNEEYNLISNYFSQDDKIKWREFCDSIEEVFTYKELEHKPDFDVKEGRTVTNYGKMSQSQEDELLANQIVEKFMYFLARERLNCKSFFQDWDRHRHFKVTPKQFRQVLACLNFNMTDQEFNAILKKYKDHDSGDILYLKFIEDAKGLPEFLGLSQSQANGQFLFEPEDWKTINKVIDLIKNLAKQNSLRMNEYFQDHDPLRKGFIFSSKFRSALEMLKLNLSKKEIELLEEKFRSKEDKDKIDIISFANTIDVIFTEKELEKSPLKKPIDFSVTKIPIPESEMTEEEKVNVHKCILRLADIVKKRRLLLKPLFQDKVFLT